MDAGAITVVTGGEWVAQMLLDPCALVDRKGSVQPALSGWAESRPSVRSPILGEGHPLLAGDSSIVRVLGVLGVARLAVPLPLASFERPPLLLGVQQSLPLRGTVGR